VAESDGTERYNAMQMSVINQQCEGLSREIPASSRRRESFREWDGYPRRGGVQIGEAISPFRLASPPDDVKELCPSERRGLLRRNDSAVTFSSAKHERLI